MTRIRASYRMHTKGGRGADAAYDRFYVLPSHGVVIHAEAGAKGFGAVYVENYTSYHKSWLGPVAERGTMILPSYVKRDDVLGSLDQRFYEEGEGYDDDF